MNRTQRQAVLVGLVEYLRAQDSWCGEVHVQKAAFLLQELFGVPLELNFVFYKNGPHSFDLSDEITALRADLLLTVQAREPHGPGLRATENARRFLARFGDTLRAQGLTIQFVARKVAPLSVAELERLATALYASLQRPTASVEEVVSEIHRLRPQVSAAEARTALELVTQMRADLELLNPVG